METTAPRKVFLPFSKPSLGEEEIGEVTACLRSGWITTGPRTELFEREFSAYVGSRHAVALSSGTAALHCAYWALDLGPGDEIICPSLTWPATANMAVALGAKAVFADIDGKTLQIDAKDVARRITKRTKAIVPVHFAGAPADVDALREIAGSRIRIVEDAAHSVGTEYKGRRVGGLGNAAIFSFHPIKDMTTGEGGMLTTEDDELARRVRLFKFHGVSRDAWKAYGAASSARYDTVLPGFKYNLTDIASAIGIHQLRKLDGFIARRTAIAGRYLRGLAGAPGVDLPVAPPYPHVHAWHLFTILVDRRDEFMTALRDENIGTGLHFEPVHKMTAYRLPGESLPETERAGARILSLPLFPGMSDEDADDVIAAVRRIAGRLSR
ncbi:MAG TPA: aminotransferase class I/II-fold pyridoxal phosphate-dependent enzyme [Planctomycetota bacterium]|nr:aminotransferase class I/II-fold pyridoxal phosphate-dependent enzyme [Planctomycetota bacterium]